MRCGSDTLLCACRGITHADAERAIAAGATTVKSVFTGCGTLPKCGQCVWDVRDLLNNARSNAEVLAEAAAIGA